MCDIVCLSRPNAMQANSMQANLQALSTQDEAFNIFITTARTVCIATSVFCAIALAATRAPEFIVATIVATVLTYLLFSFDDFISPVAAMPSSAAHVVARSAHSAGAVVFTSPAIANPAPSVVAMPMAMPVQHLHMPLPPVAPFVAMPPVYDPTERGTLRTREADAFASPYLLPPATAAAMSPVLSHAMVGGGAALPLAAPQRRAGTPLPSAPFVVNSPIPTPLRVQPLPSTALPTTPISPVAALPATAAGAIGAPVFDAAARGSLRTRAVSPAPGAVYPLFTTAQPLATVRPITRAAAQATDLAARGELRTREGQSAAAAAVSAAISAPALPAQAVVRAPRDEGTDLAARGVLRRRT